MIPAIEISDLSKTFSDVYAVKSLSLTVPSGAFFGFVGPNGAGKTTTIRLLLGLLQPTSGSIRVLDRSISGDTAHLRRLIGVVPEGLALFDYLTGWEHLTFVGKMFGLDHQTIKSRSDELMNLMELENSADTLTMNYSFGMKKKLAMAAALLPNPRLLILDEPFESIDPVTRNLLEQILKELVTRKVTVFMTSHALDLVERLCSEAAIICGGSLVVTGAMTDLTHEFGTLEKLFLNSIPPNEQRTSKLSWLRTKNDDTLPG
ncbi:MAG: ABC transporter ATP-binding protein [Acidobacteriia bacterium]|nr:ABC transporter ATP-binding protein [Terriglobia bacterium]